MFREEAERLERRLWGKTSTKNQYQIGVLSSSQATDLEPAGCSKTAHLHGFRLDGAAQESNLPSRGLHDLTGFEDRLSHRAHAAPRLA